MNNDIELLKIRMGWKRLPLLFYFQMMFALLFPIALVVGVCYHIFHFDKIFGYVVIIPFAVFIGYKTYKKYEKDKLKGEENKC